MADEKQLKASTFIHYIIIGDETMTDKSKLTLDDLLNQAVYSIPDYQRGYSWEKEQVKELADDISNIVQWNDSSPGTSSIHYMGTIITYDTKRQRKYLNTQKPVKEIVDGQQRLISISLFLAAVLYRLKQAPKDDADYNDSIKRYLYCSGTTRINLHDESDNAFYLNLLKNGGKADESTSEPASFTASRLSAAGAYLNDFVSRQSDETLEKIYDVITSRIVFTTYEIDELAEIGMTFELVNNRGKHLTVFELFKNYLLYWCYRNVPDRDKREELTAEINRTWKTVYENINEVKTSDSLVDQFLRYVYIIVSGNVTWDGYKSLKTHLPIRQSFDDDTKKIIDDLLTNLASLSKHFKDIKDGGGEDVVNSGILNEKDAVVEYSYLSAIIHSGYSDAFMPLLLLARYALWKRFVSASHYLELLKTIECFIYRTYLIVGYRNNYRKNEFYRRASILWCGLCHDRFVQMEDGLQETQTLNYDIDSFVSSIRVFSASLSEVEEVIKAPLDWFHTKWDALKYTLFEYEKWLIEQRQPGYPVAVEWGKLDDKMTREHILPQTLTDYWRAKWSKEDFILWINDIGNILLTLDNSVYSNHPYPRKCRGEDENGSIITDKYYANSTLMQEREMVKYQKWTVDEVKQRHNELVEFILKRWSFE